MDANQFVIRASCSTAAPRQRSAPAVPNAIPNGPLCADGKWRALDSGTIHRGGAALARSVGAGVMRGRCSPKRLGCRFSSGGGTVGARGRGGDQRAQNDQFASSTVHRGVDGGAGEELGAFAQKYAVTRSPAERKQDPEGRTWAHTGAAADNTRGGLRQRLDGGRPRGPPPETMLTGWRRYAGRGWRGRACAGEVAHLVTPVDVMLREVELAAAARRPDPLGSGWARTFGPPRPTWASRRPRSRRGE